MSWSGSVARRILYDVVLEACIAAGSWWRWGVQPSLRISRYEHNAVILPSFDLVSAE